MELETIEKLNMTREVFVERERLAGNTITLSLQSTILGQVRKLSRQATLVIERFILDDEIHTPEQGHGNQVA